MLSDDDDDNDDMEFLRCKKRRSKTPAWGYKTNNK